MREWVIVLNGGVSLEDQVVNHPQRPDQMVYDMLRAALREQAAYGERPSPAPGPDLPQPLRKGRPGASRAAPLSVKAILRGL